MRRKCKNIQRHERIDAGRGFEKFWGHKPSDYEIAKDMNGLFNWCDIHEIFWGAVNYPRCPMCIADE